MKKIKMLLLIALVFPAFIIFCIIIGEEDTAKSKYDERYVAYEDKVKLNSQDFDKLQDEIIDFIKSNNKTTDKLKYINVYLDNELELSRIIFGYELRDIEKFVGIFETQCENENGYWFITRAESTYYYGEDYIEDSTYSYLKEENLEEKINEICAYIESKDKEKVDVYLIQIDGENINIDAHNVGDDNSENNWREDYIISNKMSYKVDKQDDNYFVQIMDSQGEIIYENLYMLEPVVEKIGENTVVVTVGRGDQWNTVFVNGQTGEVSETFGNVCAYNENIVVYGIYDGQLKIIIRDVYDTGNLYKEIIDNFPSVAVGSYLIKDAKVISDNFVYLNYYVSSDVAEDESTAKLIYIGDWRIGD